MLQALLLVVALSSPQSPVWPAEVEAALVLAGDHRAELEKVLHHYRDGDDPLKFEAACFLIANMEGHGYAEYGLFDADGKEVPFDALQYAGYGAAQQAMDALEKEQGKLTFKTRRFVADLDTIEAGFLIENIDLAFEAWRGKPWAKPLSFAAFCEHVLPYRGSNEPLEPWRRQLHERFAGNGESNAELADLQAATGRAGRQVGSLIGFSDLYYLHPTDQGFSEMCERHRGRCEDITNMEAYVMRANAIAVAADYTPWWPHRDNNHAWTVYLDADGKGRSGAGGPAAKVYRKTYALQRQNLAFQLRDGEKAPGWLRGKTYKDVTAQYKETSDVTVALTRLPETPQRFAYLCVFNEGEWRAIHWAWTVDGSANFTAMGRNVLYLPAWYVDEKLVGAAAPFWLRADGSCETFACSDSETTSCVLSARAGSSHELFVWKDGWTSLGRKEAGDDGVACEGVPVGGLYWLVEDGSRRLERPFALGGGEPRRM